MLVKNSQSTSEVFKFYRTINKICSKNPKFKLNVTSIEDKPYACVVTDDSFYIYNLENISIQFYIYCGESGRESEGESIKESENERNSENQNDNERNTGRESKNAELSNSKSKDCFGINLISFYCLNKWNVYICYSSHIDVYYRGDIIGKINFPKFTKIAGSWKFEDEKCLVLTISTKNKEEISTINLIQKNKIINSVGFNFKILTILVPKNYKNKILILDSKNSLSLYNLKTKSVIYEFKRDFSKIETKNTMKKKDSSNKNEFIISMFPTDVDDVILIHTNKDRIFGFNIRKDKILVNFNNFIPQLNDKVISKDKGILNDKVIVNEEEILNDKVIVNEEEILNEEEIVNQEEITKDKIFIKEIVYKLSNAMVCGKFGLFIFSKELEIWDLELKVKIFYKIDVIDAFMLNSEMFLLINETGIYIYEYNGIKFDILKKRETLVNIDFISGNEDLIIGNSKLNEIMAINIFKDQQNRFLSKNILFEKIIINNDINSLENINNLIIYGNEKVYLLNKEFKKKNCIFLINKKCDWINFNSDILICGTDENIIYLINVHSKRVMGKFKIGDDINKKNRIFDGILEFDKIVLLLSNRIIELNFNYKILKIINLNYPEELDSIKETASIKKFGNFYFIFKNNQVSIAKDSISRTFKCSSYFVDESVNYIGLINGGNIQVRDIISGIIFSDIQINIEIKSGLFSTKMQFMILLDKLDGHVHLFSNNSLFKKNKKIKKNITKQKATTGFFNVNNNFNSAEKFVCDLNRSLELAINNNDKSLGCEKVLPKLNTNLYKEILLFKSCLSKNDVDFYLKSLNKEEVNLLLKIMIKVDKKTKVNNRVDNSILLNRLLLYKSKFIDYDVIKYFLNSYEEEMAVYDDGIIKAINYMRI